MIIIGFLFSILIGCEKESEPTDKLYTAEIVGYDLNCSTCILYFPNDSSIIKEVIGESELNFYQTVNLDLSDFEIGELIQANVRLAEDSELRACKTLYPTYAYTNIYVLDYSKYEGSHFIDTIELKYGECITTFGQATLCFDTILNDSRCPEGAMCFWEGNAKVKFIFI